MSRHGDTVTPMTSQDAAAFVGDLEPQDLVAKLRTDGYDHPHLLAEALGIDGDGGAKEVAFRVVNQVQGVMCQVCAERPVEIYTAWLDGGEVEICSYCLTTYSDDLTDRECRVG